MRVDEGAKGRCLLAMKIPGKNRRGEEREKSLLCDIGSELQLGRRDREHKGEDNKWDGRKNKNIREKKILSA